MNSVNIFEMYEASDDTAFFNRGTPDKSEKERQEAEDIVNLYLKDSVGSIEGYQIINTIDEGTYGVVYKAIHKQTGELVAVKQLKFFDFEERISIAAARELKLSMSMWHLNIVKAHEVAMGSSIKEIYIIMDYLPHQLRSVMDKVRNTRQTFYAEHIHCLMQQLLEAVRHLHLYRIVHRDLKPENILICKHGYLKVADFGMSREYELSPRQYTPTVCTLWYRAPELLLLSSNYSYSVDMWSIGCIFAELINMWPLFYGKSESDQLKKIYKVLGTPSETVWPGYSELPLVGDILFKEYAPSGLRKEIKHEILSNNGLSLLERLLTYDPNRRITAAEALQHNYFEDEPVAIDPENFLRSLDLEDEEQ